MKRDDVADRVTLGSTTPTVASPSEPPKLATFVRSGDHFEMGEELGRGGMGRVVAAKDVALDRAVAIKQVLSEDAPDLARFEREVRITAQLEHPSIVPIHEAGTDDRGRPYYVMRRIEGEPLTERVAKASDVRARIALVPNMLAVVDAAAFAHARNIIHRDIKPSNILLGSYGETLLIDWGLARRVDEDVDLPGSSSGDETEPLTRAGDIYGTVGYMSPEQARGERVDARADVFALGATLFHVLTGRSPFEGMSVVDRIASAALGHPPPLDKIGPEVPRELVTIVGKAMAAGLDARYRDAGELAADLRAFLAGQLVAAHHYTTRDRLVRFVRRHRLVVAIAAVALVTVIVVGVVAITGVVRARDEAEDARVDAVQLKTAAELAAQTLAERAEVMLLDRASALATQDPTRAVALLRHDWSGATNLRRARDIASVAAAKGIAHGTVDAIPDRVYVLAISPDGRWLAQAGATGRIHFHELVTGKTRVFPGIGTPVTLGVWADGGKTFVVNGDPYGLFAIDVATGAHRTIDAKANAETIWTAGANDERVRFFDRERKVVVECSTRSDEPERILASGVTAAVGSADLALILGDNQIRLLDGDRETLVAAMPKPVDVHALAIAPTHAFVAAVVDNDVIEWNVATKKQAHRWTASDVATLAYGREGLYGVDRFGSLLGFGSYVKPFIELKTEYSSMAWGASTTEEVAFIYDDGTLVLLGEGNVYRFAFDLPGTRVIATSPHSHYIAIGNANGTVRWWNLAHLTAKKYHHPGSWCWSDATTIFLSEPLELYAVDRATGRSRTYDDPYFQEPPVCLGSVPGHLALVTAVRNKPGILDLKTGTVTTPENVAGLVVDDLANRILYVRDRQLIELTNGEGPERVRWTAPAPIGPFASTGRWFVASTTNEIVRLDRMADPITIARSAASIIGVMADGQVFWGTKTELWWWNGSSAKLLRTLAAEITGYGLTDGWVYFKLADGSLWITDGSQVLNRAPTGSNRKFGFGPGGRVMIYDGSKRFEVRYLVGGVTLKRDASGIDRIGIDGEGTVMTSGARRVFVFEDPVPDDPTKLQAWIDTATNAAVDPTTDELTWR